MTDPHSNRFVNSRPTALLTGSHVGGRLLVPDEGLQVVGAHLRDVDASNLAGVAGNLSFWGTILEDCDFSGSDLANVLLSGAVADPTSRSVFRRCRFDNASLVLAGLNHTRFEDCVFDHADLERVQFHQNDLVDNVFLGPVKEVTLWGLAPQWKRDASIRPNEIHGNDFSMAAITGLGLANGVRVSEQRWPDDPHVVFVRDVPARARQAMERLDTNRPGARLVYDALDDLAYDGLQEEWVFFLNDPLLSEAKKQAMHLLLSLG